MLIKGYKMVKDPPPSISWGEYEAHMINEYRLLLSEHPDDEKAFQVFFEKYPSMLPGAFGMLGESGHYPYNTTAISQPELNGLSTKIPDFMWIACDSGTVYPVLIEIEAPSKSWFISSGKPSEKFHQALDQLTDWRLWFSNPKNRLLFFDYFGVSSRFYEGKSVVPVYVLIYGRRSEFEGKPQLNEKRKQLVREDEFHMTYDRLSPSYKARHALCCRVKDREYYAVSVPATLQLGPAFAEDYLKIRNREKAILANDLISPERKKFLVGRLPYWDEYARGPRGFMYTGDFE